MTAPALHDTATELLAGDRGILAMDETIATCNRRLAAAGIDQETESRRAYRELLVSTPGLAESIHGAILFPQPNMVLPGSGCNERPRAEEVADATLACLLRAVRAAVPRIDIKGSRSTTTDPTPPGPPPTVSMQIPHER